VLDLTVPRKRPRLEPRLQHLGRRDVHRGPRPASHGRGPAGRAGGPEDPPPDALSAARGSLPRSGAECSGTRQGRALAKHFISSTASRSDS